MKQNLIHQSIDTLTGETPLLELSGIEKKYGLATHILAKLEYFNPAGSIKDRIAKSILDEAEKSGILKPGATLIEPTSGNTGIGLAAFCAARGYKLILVMPESMSVERRRQMGAYGARLVLTPAAEGMKGAIARAEEIRDATPGAIIAGQFDNPANPRAHYESTGPEIWRQTKGNIQYLVAGVGTGGTLSGAGRFLKEKNPAIQIIAVEPAASPVLSRGYAEAHKIQGIGAGFVPKNLDRSIIDEVIAVPDQDAMDMTATLARCVGILVGISSGAAVWASVQASRTAAPDSTIVAVLPDSGDRYLSTGVYEVE